MLAVFPVPLHLSRRTLAWTGLAVTASFLCLRSGRRQLPPCSGAAGDATHGAKMVYDVLPDGSEQYALALVLSIYTLPGSGEAYFEHRYFLSATDLEERPMWRIFLKVGPRSAKV
jgi:hypothetical protein